MLKRTLTLNCRLLSTMNSVLLEIQGLLQVNYMVLLAIESILQMRRIILACRAKLFFF
ncbi:hypothetical protein C5167_021725, partial [Papaver somniferum]